MCMVLSRVSGRWTIDERGGIEKEENTIEILFYVLRRNVQILFLFYHSLISYVLIIVYVHCAIPK